MYEIIVHAHPHCEEAIAAFLESYHIQSAIKILTTEGEEGISFYLVREDWSRFQGRFEAKLQEISEIFETPLPQLTMKTLDDDAWKNAWKRYARIYRFGKELVVKPTWRKLRKPPNCPVISIDPRMAFGTGGHASTRLCIYHLLQIRRERPGCLKMVLDVGTGSGILSIVAAQLGACRVVATDIDADVVQIAMENAAKNNVVTRIEFITTPLDKIPGKYSLILANIYESALSELLEEFAKHLQLGGILVVSGLMANQGKDFVKKAERFGLRKVSRRFSRPWVSYGFEGLK
jgi:ribosomal protein L11 methyltransferase